MENLTLRLMPFFLSFAFLTVNATNVQAQARPAKKYDQVIPSEDMFRQMVAAANEIGGIKISDNQEVFDELIQVIETPKAALQSQGTLKRMLVVLKQLRPLFHDNQVPIEMLALASARTGIGNMVAQADCEECGVGLWGLTVDQARTIGLRAENESAESSDSRLDMRKSTEAVIKYGKSIFPKHNDWVLVALESHLGAAVMDSARSTSQPKDPWAIAAPYPGASKLLARWMASILIARFPMLVGPIDTKTVDTVEDLIGPIPNIGILPTR